MTEEEKIEGREGATDESGLLLPIETLLSSGIHIGTRIKTKDMIAFIYRVRPDGLFVLDVKQTDERIRAAAKFLARFDPSRVIVVSTRLYGITPVKKFCEVTSATPVIGRFLPGIFSNPNHSSHIEADAVVVTDPKADRQAVREAALVGIPVVALCDTDNDFSKVDFIIPANNKGRRSLATIYWLLARQILREKGEIAPDGDLSTPIDDFETKLVEVPSMME
ncbi:30S ribosomal protein S2 [miscellaneous Crenarchaeota group archaeon SMTZ1-55]|nr:MAG: 30S ribosomal protein S2 [miscellaneous Crenarchaeota group archaeon SMTZ1-55]